jgi:hypothetical protein
MHDPVNSPSHYADSFGGIQCIEAIEAAMGTEAFKGFIRGNAIKYLWRYDKKNGAEDLRKAKWYLERLITICEMEEAMEKTMREKTKETFGISYDPDDYMASGCPDGFCPMPGMRQGPSEELFKPV